MKKFSVALLCLSALLVGCAAVPSEDGDAMMEEDGAMMEDDAKMDGGAMEKKPAPAVEEQAMDCAQKNEECGTSADCCTGMGLECRQVRTSDGGFGNRCLPAEVQICKSDCTDGTWSKPRACKTAVAPKSMTRCETFVGDACTLGSGGSRNTRECVDT